MPPEQSPSLSNRQVKSACSDGEGAKPALKYLASIEYLTPAPYPKLWPAMRTLSSRTIKAPRSLAGSWYMALYFKTMPGAEYGTPLWFFKGAAESPSLPRDRGESGLGVEPDARLRNCDTRNLTQPSPAPAYDCRGFQAFGRNQESGYRHRRQMSPR
jgi:hypothetical protein